MSRREHHTAQTRELVATKLVLPQLLPEVMMFSHSHNNVLIFNTFTGLHVTEVAHDFQTQVTAYIKGKHDGKPELVNSFDTWHGNH